VTGNSLRREPNDYTSKKENHWDSKVEGYHVITHHAGTAEVVGAIKDGLEQDGLGDLVLAVVQGDPGAAKVHLV
jgi:hypothetical protein